LIKGVVLIFEGRRIREEITYTCDERGRIELKEGIIHRAKRNKGLHDFMCNKSSFTKY
jgi:hypothetical protein